MRARHARGATLPQVSATGLRNVELLSKSDPFLEISRSAPVSGQGASATHFCTGAGAGGTRHAQPAYSTRRLAPWPSLSLSRPSHVPWLSDVPVAQGGGAGGWQPVFKTEVKPNNLNPSWQPITIKASVLNNADPDRPLLLKVRPPARSRPRSCCSTRRFHP